MRKSLADRKKYISVEPVLAADVTQDAGPKNPPKPEIGQGLHGLSASGLLPPALMYVRLTTPARGTTSRIVLMTKLAKMKSVGHG
jgi:hypothetical protein